MQSSVRIFSYLPNPRVWKATIAGRLCGVDVEVRGGSPDVIKSWLWDFDARPLSEVGADELKGLARVGRRGFADIVLYKTERFLDAHPFGTVPAAFSADGKIGVFESNSIMRLVARLGADRLSLFGKNPFEASRVDSFLDAGLSFGHDTQRYLLALRAGKLEGNVHGWAQQATANYLGGIERALTGGATCLVGEEITLADICFACELALLTNEQLSAGVLRSLSLSPTLSGEQWEAFPNSLAHFERLVGHPAFAADLSSYSHRYELMRQTSWHRDIPSDGSGHAP